MPDNTPRLPARGGTPPQTTGPGEAPPDQIDPEFDEVTYLRVYPDVAAAVRRGEFNTGLEHYLFAGKTERRLQLPEYRQTTNPPATTAGEPRFSAARARPPGAGVDV